jgi:uncharacterized membrane protein
MDTFADGRLLVFVPGTPAPMSGALYIFTPDKVTYVDVPLLSFIKAISSWGLGLRDIIEAQKTEIALGQVSESGRVGNLAGRTMRQPS